MKRRGEVRIAGAAVLLAGLAALAACGDSGTDPQPIPIEDQVFAPSLGVDLDAMTMTSTGLYYEDLEIGEGTEAAIGDEATVSYTGWLANGTSFDSGSFNFPVSAGGAIPGFVEGVVGMRVGGERLLAIPYQLAYGAQGTSDGAIPPYANIVFRVELLSVQIPGT